MTQDGGMRAYGPLFLLGALLMGATGRRAEAASPTPDEMGLRRGWVEASFRGDSAQGAALLLPLRRCGVCPLTSYSLAGDVWMAWQFDRPESGDGVIMAFRRAQSPYEIARFRLSDLDPGAR